MIAGKINKSIYTVEYIVQHGEFYFISSSGAIRRIANWILCSK